MQCGICTPGFIVAAKALLDHNPRTPANKRSAFSWPDNLCRCTGYDKIVRAVQDAATALQKEHAGWPPKPRAKSKPTRREGRHRRLPAAVPSARHAARPPRRRRQGDRSGHVRRPTCRWPGMAHGRDPPQPARARADQVDRHERRGEAARRAGRRDRATISPIWTTRSRPWAKAGRVNLAHLGANCWRRDKALYKGHVVAAVAATNVAHRRRSRGEADPRRIRAAARRSLGARRHEGRRAAAARQVCGPIEWARKATSRRTSPCICTSKRGTSRRDSPGADVVDRARVHAPPPCTRATSSRTTRRRFGTPTATSRSGPHARRVQLPTSSGRAAADAGLAERRSCRGDRRRLRRQDRRLSRAGGGGAESQDAAGR